MDTAYTLQPLIIKVNMRKIVLSIFVASAGIAHAVTLTGFSATDVVGADSNPLADESSSFLIADGGDGFGFVSGADIDQGVTFSVGSLVTGTNDYVFAYNGAQNFGTFSVVSGNASFSLNDNVELSGSSFALLYFDFVGGSTVVTSGGMDFGFYTVTSGPSSSQWIIPTEESADINFSTSGSGFSQFTEEIGITGTVVPESSTYALFAGVLALGYIVVRRSRASF